MILGEINLLHLELGENMRKIFPVLTEVSCIHMEMLRRALEVQIGKRVSFYQLDMNTGRAGIFAGDDEFDIEYRITDFARIQFQLEEKWYYGSFEKADVVRVGSDSSTHICNTVVGEFKMVWVGSSFVDRREEPLFPKDVEYCAKARGLTVQKFLNSKPEAST